MLQDIYMIKYFFAICVSAVFVYTNTYKYNI